MKKAKILITGKLHDAAIQKFNQMQAAQMFYLPDCPRKTLLKEVQDATVLVTRSETTVDAEVIERGQQLKLIARAAVGVGNIAIDEATQAGILVINCPGKNANSAAELSFSLLLASLRPFIAASNHLKKGGWDRHLFTGKELLEKKIGLIGLGNVGKRMAHFCRSFGMQVYAYDPYLSEDQFETRQVQSVPSLEELIQACPILSFHVPANKETKAMMSAAFFAMLRPQTTLINAARGEIVDEEALLAWLESPDAGSYAVDTFAHEPDINRQLVDHPKVIPTPHIGASTDEAQYRIGMTVYSEVDKVLNGFIAEYPVNLPGIGVPQSNVEKAYSVLAQKLGSATSQLLDFEPSEMELIFRGSIASLDSRFIRLAFLQGFGAQRFGKHISFVNAGQAFDKLGVKLIIEKDRYFKGYKSGLKVIAKKNQQSLSLGGVVFDDAHLKISMLDGFSLEADPEGQMLVLRNKDRPGVVGAVGQVLANHQVNIDQFHLSRNKKGGEALAIVSIDQECSPDLINDLQSLENILTVKSLCFSA